MDYRTFRCKHFKIHTGLSENARKMFDDRKWRADHFPMSRRGGSDEMFKWSCATASVMLRDGLNGASTEKNFVLSPLSFLLALAPLPAVRRVKRKKLLRLYPGCEDVKELSKVVRKVVTTPNESLRFWGCLVTDPVRVPLNESDSKSLSKDFGISVFPGHDLAQLASEITSRVSEATDGRIRLSLSAEQLHHLVVVVNVVSFRDDWEQIFPESPYVLFKCRDGSVISCPFMENTIECEYWQVGDFRCVNLKYVHGSQMSILLPKDRSASYDLNENILEDILTARRSVKLVHLRIPKWSVDPEEHELKRIIKSVCGARFRDLRVRQITRIEVDEEGTKAEAVTIVSDGSCDSSFECETPVIEFFADHPFYYVIWDDAGISFCGYVGKP